MIRIIRAFLLLNYGQNPAQRKKMPKPRRVNKMMGRDYGKGMRKMMTPPKILNNLRNIPKKYKISNNEENSN
jgi:hypothetical protein